MHKHDLLSLPKYVIALADIGHSLASLAEGEGERFDGSRRNRAGVVGGTNGAGYEAFSYLSVTLPFPVRRTGKPLLMTLIQPPPR